MKISFISWVRFHRRCDLLAQALGAEMHYICHGREGMILLAPLRYAVQAWQSWQVLRSDRPDIVFVQNPPIFCVLVASVYAWWHGAEFVIDSHTGAFLSPKWRWAIGLHRRLSQRALVTIVHNRYQAEVVRSWGSRHCVVAFTPGAYPEGEAFPCDGHFNIAVINGFIGDEPLDLVFEAVGHLPEVRFYLTGDTSSIAPALLARKPDNCELTGYLDYERYVGLLRTADAVMVLTDRDRTLLMGGFESVSLETPLIVSDWPILRDYFRLGTVHVPNTVEGVCEGVHKTQQNLADLQRGMFLLRKQLELEWEQQFALLQHMVCERPV